VGEWDISRHDAHVPSLLHRGHTDTGEWLALARDPEADPEALRGLVVPAKRAPDVVRALAANPRTPPDALRRLSRHRRWDVRALVAANPSADEKTLDQLACDESWAVAVALAARPDIPGRMLRGAEHWTAHERFALAGNPHVPVEALERLLTDEDVYVRGRAAANPSARPASLRALAQDMSEPPWVLRAVAANPALPPDLAEELLTWIALGGTGAGDPTFDPVACVGNPVDASTPEFFFYQHEAQQPDAHESVLIRVRASIPGANGRTPVRVIEELAHDAAPSVRAVASMFAELPRDVLEELTEDADTQVARNATAALERHRKLARERRWSKRAVSWRSLVPGAIAIAIFSFVNGLGDNGGGSSSDRLPISIEDLIDQSPPSLESDVSTEPPPVETRLSGGARVRTGFAPNQTSARVWFDAGSRPLQVIELEVTTFAGSSYLFDGFTVPAGGQSHLVVAADALTGIDAVTIHTYAGDTEIKIHGR
jgi:hypothetical protein